MRLTLRLSKTEREKMLGAAEVFGLTPAEFFAGGPRLFGLVLGKQREVGGELSIVVKSGGETRFYPVVIPSLEEFRSSPAASLVPESPEYEPSEVAGTTVVKVEADEDVLQDLQNLLHADSWQEAYGYAIFTFASLLHTAGQYEGAQLAIRARRDNRVYPFALRTDDPEFLA